MGDQTTTRTIWRVVRRQHGVIARRQLLALGLSAKAIKHRVRTGRLRPIWRGVYVVGRANLTAEGWWMAAVLACGDSAVLSHQSAATLWGLRPAATRRIHVSLPRPHDACHRGILVHRRADLAPHETTVHRSIPVTTPLRTIVDITPSLDDLQLEALVNKADAAELLSIEQLRQGIADLRHPGVRRLRGLIDRATFALTDSELERLFLPIARRAGLPKPITQAVVNGHRVDFHWPSLGLVVETDGGRFHRTALQQTRDRRRDQAHAAAGLTGLRFTHAQVRFEPRYVEATLRAVSAQAAAAGR